VGRVDRPQIRDPPQKVNRDPRLGLRRLSTGHAKAGQPLSGAALFCLGRRHVFAIVIDVSHARTMSSRTAIATLKLVALLSLLTCMHALHSFLVGRLCLRYEQQTNVSPSLWQLPHLRNASSGERGALPQDCLPTAQLRRDTFSLPTKSDASLCVGTGPGVMRLSRCGQDRLAFLAHDANHRCGGTTRVWCSRTKRGGCAPCETKVSKEGSPSACIDLRPAWCGGVVAHRQTGPPGREVIQRRRALAVWAMPDKGKIGKKSCTHRPRLALAGVEAKSTFRLRRNRGICTLEQDGHARSFRSTDVAQPAASRLFACLGNGRRSA
jgi:hypothetical protein